MKTLIQLLYEQSDLLSDPSFAKWFNGSKVVDSNNNPLVVYRGDRTPTTDYNQATRQLTFFTKDLAIARSFGSHVNKAVLSIKTPFIINTNADWTDIPIYELFNQSTAFDIVQYTYPDYYQDSDDYLSEREPISIDQLALYLKQNKPQYDGVIAYNLHEGPKLIKTTVYITFNPNQIKLV